MTAHAKIYMDYFDLGMQDICQCEGCMREGRIDGQGWDIHHIWGRGNDKDVIQNLMLLCRKCHEKAHSILTKNDMQYIHNNVLQGNRKTFIK